MQISLILKIQSLSVWTSSCENYSLLAEAKCHVRCLENDGIFKIVLLVVIFLDDISTNFKRQSSCLLSHLQTLLGRRGLELLGADDR